MKRFTFLTFFSSFIVIWPLVISCLVSNIVWRFRISDLQETSRWTKIMWKQLVDCFLINGWARSQWLIEFTTRRAICIFHLRERGGGGGTIFGEGFRVFRYSNYKFHDSYLTSYLCTDWKINHLSLEVFLCLILLINNLFKTKCIKVNTTEY